MLRTSWRPQVAILSISHTVRRIYLSITLARWGAKMLPRCSDLLASTAKPRSYLHPKHRLKRCEETINRSKSSATRSGYEHDALRRAKSIDGVSPIYREACRHWLDLCDPQNI